MKKRRQFSKSPSVFLIELMISILFLSLCSAVCVRLFVQARQLSRQSSRQTQAVTVCQNLAEIFEAAAEQATADQDGLDRAAGQLMDFFPDAAVRVDPETVQIYFDSRFHPSPPADAVYTAVVRLSVNPRLLTANIRFLTVAESEELFALSVSQALFTDNALPARYERGGII